MPQKSKHAFFVDENTSRTLVSKLLSLGYQAEHVHEVGLKGHPDEDVFAYAQMHEQTIITADLDFSNVLHYPPPHHGIIVIRIPDNVPIPERIQEIINTLDALLDEDFKDTLITIEKGRFRIRC
jgi:predicted nuclease of predicted toxin-antitoxin system